MQSENFYIFTHQKSYVHISFNSSFLCTLALAFPDSHLNIYAYQSHIDLLSKEVNIFSSSFFCLPELQVKKISFKLLNRFLSLFIWMREIIQIFSKNKVDEFIFLDIGRHQLYIIKILILLKMIPKKTKFIVVAHDTFEPLLWDNAPVRKFLNSTFSWLPILKNSFCYVVLSKHIKDHIFAYYSKINLDIQVLDHPAYIATKQVNACDSVNSYFKDKNECCINFTFIGTPQKGIDEFLQIANNVKENVMVCQKVQFFLAGYLGKNISSSNVPSTLINASIEPICYDKYLDILSDSHYVLWFAFHNPYQLRASGTIVEAIQLEKPIICLKNPLVSYYFERFGNIGYCCNSLDEIIKLIIEISGEFPLKEYKIQIANLRSIKNSFAPKYVAQDLKKIIKSSYQ